MGGGFLNWGLTSTGGGGKRFADGRAVNLLRRHRNGPLQVSLTMQSALALALAPSTIDGRTTLRLQYPREAGVPWRWAVDELRPLADGGWLGMMHLELPLLRRLHFPFLLTPTERP